MKRSSNPSVKIVLAAGVLLPFAIHAAEVRFGQAAALNQMKAMKVAPGLEATLFAAEPNVVNPADMDIDARGRVWVTEGANYRVSYLSRRRGQA